MYVLKDENLEKQGILLLICILYFCSRKQERPMRIIIKSYQTLSSCFDFEDLMLKNRCQRDFRLIGIHVMHKAKI